MLTADEKSKVIKEHAAGKTDVGSTAVQIGLLTERINQLTGHLKQHQKDLHSERGLLLMVSRRRRLLDYLQRTDEPAYQVLIKKLKIRK